MRTTALCLLLLVGAATAFVERGEWQAFKDKHGKSYANIMEEVHRMKVYSDNKAYVEKHMKEHAEGKHTFTVELNKFADLTTEEWSATYKGLIMGSTEPHKMQEPSGKPQVDALDWRDYGMVTAVKDQGQCGSCWAFSSTGAIEGAWGRSHTYQDIISLSEQQLVDCTRQSPYGNQGCNGGWMDAAFHYVKDHGGIASEASYPYETRDNNCRDAYYSSVSTVTGWTDVIKGNEASLQDGLNWGPVAVAIDASKQSFQLYSGGIYNEPACSSTQLDHGVLVVGFGPGYWIVKNSWGPNWGLQGYIQMTKDYYNQCGIATSASYPWYST